VLLDVETGALHVLNGAAAVVWAELDGERTVDAIVADLSTAAGADTVRVHADVTGFLDQLQRSGLLSAGSSEGFG
jgi:hypothetical protein